jgi:hypothetical protein
MVDLKAATEIAKRYIVPTLLALIILGGPLGYSFYRLHMERSALTDLQVGLRGKFEKSLAELEAKNAKREAELDEKAKGLGAKEAEIILAANQLKKSLISVNQHDQDCQTELAKLQHEQAPVLQKTKRTPLKLGARVSAKKYPYLGRKLKKPAASKAPLPAIAIAPPVAPPPPAVKIVEILPQSRPLGACPSNDGGTGTTRELTRLKRKISATRFKVNFRPATRIPNVRTGLPEDLLRRLAEGDVFLPRNVSLGIGYPPINAQADPLSSADDAREVAFKTGSQFILSGVIDAGMGRSDYGRWIEVEVDAYDGLTGVRVAKIRQGMEIASETEIEIRSTFGSAKYFSTPFGKRFDALMKSLISAIGNDLACAPFVAKITDIDAENNKIYIDGGATSRVAPGDKFVAFHSIRRIQSESATNGLLGAQTIPLASVTIQQVSPLFSIGELSVDPRKSGLQVGDFISAQKVRMEKRFVPQPDRHSGAANGVGALTP